MIAYHKPLFIVENGLGVEDTLEVDGSVHDSYRVEYLDAHITQMKKAVLEDGIPCMGYLVWGIIDLVSAGGGEMDKRYGLVYVNKHNDGTGDLAATKKILLVGMHRRFRKSAMNKAYKQYLI